MWYKVTRIVEANSLAEAIINEGEVISVFVAGNDSKDSAIGFTIDAIPEEYDE